MSEEEEQMSSPRNGSNMDDINGNDSNDNDSDEFLDSYSELNISATPTPQEVVTEELQYADIPPRDILVTVHIPQGQISDSTSQPNRIVESFFDTSQDVQSTPSTSQRVILAEPNNSELIENVAQQDILLPPSDISEDSDDFAEFATNSDSTQDGDTYAEAQELPIPPQAMEDRLVDIVYRDMNNPGTPSLEELERADSPELEDQYEASSMDEDEQNFDISLAASHSYLGPGLVTLGGRVILEAGWTGLVPVLGHSGTVFPGETVPLCLMRPIDIELMQQALQGNKLFGLLSPDGSWTCSSGYGSLCEVYEATEPTAEPVSLNVKARATHRFRLTSSDRQNIRLYDTVVIKEVIVLPEVCLGDPLFPIRLPSLDPHRGSKSRWVRNMESVMSTWPRFVFNMIDLNRIKETLHQFFKDKHDKMPEEPISLSFWVASNLPLNKRDGLSLLMVDEALLRLTMEASIIARINILCCCSCRSAITKLEHTFAMSSEGLHSNYTNRYGYLHDVITTTAATNVAEGSEPSSEFSWFPGYAWTIIVCATCHSHVGWRFDSLRRNLRPSMFYGISRNYVQPVHTTEGIQDWP